ncbi:uncharacterized protein [Dermacentor andersoni]|uniref:uncharacterized protein n=1 Tax=Dermacentor andersoni TaxID=34620 RepID=UPI003B3B0617
MQTRLTWLVFFAQVSRKSSSHDFKSDSLGLVVVPCPGVLCECVPGCFDSLCFVVLLLSADIEMNPGPTVPEQLAAILDKQKALSNELKSIRESFLGPLASIEQKLLSLPETVLGVEECERLVSHLTGQTDFLLKKFDDLENRHRRNNLIIYGVEELETETEDSLRDAVLAEIFERKLGIKVSSLERIHRLGRKRTNRTRPVIMRFF